MMPDHVLEKLACARPNVLVILLAALGAFAVVVTADYVTEYELSLSPLYILVTLAVSWFCGAWWGGLFACLSVFAQIELGLSMGHNFSDPVYFYISNGNRLFAYLLISFLAAALRRLYGRATDAARMDFLTGLINRMGFHERISVELARHRRHGYVFAVAYIDCDYFKVINDGLGHSVGDQVLQSVGQVLKAHSRESDIVARLGGDEFALVFPQTGEFEVLKAVTKLRQQLDSAMARNNWPITFSIGVGIFPSVPENADRVIAFADKLMYRVKALGKNRVMHRVYDPDELDTIPPQQSREKGQPAA
jgi:diguanylate cyclase (GGDEF)-like protein